MTSIRKVNNIKKNPQKINIACEQITFNPMDETVTIIACELKNNQHNNENTDIPNNSKLTELSPINISDDVVENDGHHYSSTRDDVVDIISLGVIVLLLLIWMSVFISVEIKESEYNNTYNNISLNNEFMDKESSFT